MSNPYAHGTAIVHYTARIGEGSKVWAFAQICQDAKIGENCVIGKGAYIGPGVVIGDNCKIQNNALIYEGVTIGNRVFIGPNVVTTNDIDPQACGDWSERFRTTIIEDDVAIGANSTILCGVKLWRGCRIGCGSLITKDCQAWHRYYNPNTQALQMAELATLTQGTVTVEP